MKPATKMLAVRSGPGLGSTLKGISSVLLGKQHQVKLVTAALLAGEHLLLNDLPGVGKTLLATAVANVVGGSLGRIQGTPDLLPTDLTGASIYHQADDRWVFRAGPVVANVVLVDEVNRITPRTQSALLEAMAEGRVTVDGVSRPLPLPFLVVATMNPVGSVIARTIRTAPAPLPMSAKSVSAATDLPDLKIRQPVEVCWLPEAGDAFLAQGD